ncbi:MAG: envelope stress response membrane protein PspB [Gammaproteobacteria bacterium]|nr:envelope stress response membrane protein PspB [Gammaproteobacteria bacterium]
MEVEILGIMMVPLIIFLMFVLPVWVVFHYLSKIKTAKGLSKDDEALMADLWEMANKMESRIESLETILDAEVPGWRNRQ